MANKKHWLSLLMLSSAVLTGQGLAGNVTLDPFTSSDDVPVTVIPANPNFSSPLVFTAPKTPIAVTTEDPASLLPQSQSALFTAEIENGLPLLAHTEEIPVLQLFGTDTNTIEATVVQFADNIMPASIDQPASFMQIEEITFGDTDALDNTDIPVGESKPSGFSVSNLQAFNVNIEEQETLQAILSITGPETLNIQALTPKITVQNQAQVDTKAKPKQSAANKIPIILPIVQASMAFVVSADTDQRKAHVANQPAVVLPPTGGSAAVPIPVVHDNAVTRQASNSTSPTPSAIPAPEVNLETLKESVEAQKTIEASNTTANSSVQGLEKAATSNNVAATTDQSLNPATKNELNAPLHSPEVQSTKGNEASSQSDASKPNTLDSTKILPAVPAPDAVTTATQSNPNIYVFGKGTNKVLYENEFLFYPDNPLGQLASDNDAPKWLTVRMVFVMTPEGKHQVNYSLVNANKEEIVFTEPSQINLLFNGKPVQASLNRANTSQLPGYLKPQSGEYGTIKLPNLTEGTFELDWELISAGLAPRTYRLHQTWTLKRWKVYTNKPSIKEDGQ